MNYAPADRRKSYTACTEMRREMDDPFRLATQRPLDGLPYGVGGPSVS